VATAVGRGEVRIVDLGHVGKRRPCIILSVPAADSERALASIIPGTTAVWGTLFEVTLHLPFLQRDGVFDAQNLQTVSLGKFLERRGSLATE